MEISAASVVPSILLITFPLHFPHYISYELHFFTVIADSLSGKGFRAIINIYVAYQSFIPPCWHHDIEMRSLLLKLCGESTGDHRIIRLFSHKNL